MSANLTGNHTLVDIATSHADKTRINHLRPDGMVLFGFPFLSVNFESDARYLGSSFHVWNQKRGKKDKLLHFVLIATNAS